MPTSFIIQAALASFFSLVATAALGQNVGDWVTVVAESTDLRDRETVVGTICKGDNVRVVEVIGGKLRVSWHGRIGQISKDVVILTADALLFFDAAVRRNPTTPNRLAHGMVLLTAGRIEAACSAFGEAARLAPTDARVYFYRGLCWTVKGDRERADADYSEAIRRDPRYARAYANRGTMRSQMADAAIGDFTNAIQLDPYDGVSYANRGQAWVRKGELTKAIADYDEAARLDSTNYGVFFMRGDAHAEAGHWDTAITDYTESLRLLPGFGPSYQRRGDVWLSKGEPAKAAADFEEAIRRGVKGAVLHERLARAFADLGEYEKAEKQISEAIDADPKDDDSTRMKLRREFRRRGQ